MRNTISLILRGFCMGAADIVPGVSGGTMAFILGIYTELVDSIRAYGRGALWKALLRGDIQQVLEIGNVKFLLSVGGGILLAVVTLSHALEFALMQYPLQIWSAFFGLVLASVAVIRKRVKQWSMQNGSLALIGIVLAYWIVTLVPTATPDAPWFLVLSGAIAICAMILPGISGSFLLVILGKYAFILSAVNDRDVVSLAYVGIGAACGIILFAQILSWFLHHHHDAMVSFLTGLMLGSLVKIWPWKIEDINVVPSISTELWIGLGCMLIGFVVVSILEKCGESS